MLGPSAAAANNAHAPSPLSVLTVRRGGGAVVVASVSLGSDPWMLVAWYL